MQALSLAVDGNVDVGPPALLRGTQRGLEMLVNGRAEVAAITEALVTKLDEAPAFFRGNDVRISVEDGPLPPGCLAKLDELAARFELRIVEVAAAQPVPKPNLAAGSSPTATDDALEAFAEEEPTNAGLRPLPLPPIVPECAEPVTLAPSELTVAVSTETRGESFEEPTQTAVPVQLAATPDAPDPSGGPRLVIGPVRSGVILDHEGHVIVFGDVNPGAEVRATGNIIVLGRLRGTAHAGIGQDVGFILALRLEPQQLRIARMVARAGDSDVPATQAEIAHVTPAGIVVEPYVGKLPRNLATSI